MQYLLCHVHDRGAGPDQPLPEEIAEFTALPVALPPESVKGEFKPIHPSLAAELRRKPSVLYSRRRNSLKVVLQAVGERAAGKSNADIVDDPG